MEGEEKRMLTAKQFAIESGVSYPTVRKWLAEGKLEGAEKQETAFGAFWQIPAALVARVEEFYEKRGPKPAENKGSEVAPGNE